MIYFTCYVFLLVFRYLLLLSVEDNSLCEVAVCSILIWLEDNASTIFLLLDSSKRNIINYLSYLMSSSSSLLRYRLVRSRTEHDHATNLGVDGCASSRLTQFPVDCLNRLHNSPWPGLTAWCMAAAPHHHDSIFLFLGGTWSQLLASAAPEVIPIDRNFGTRHPKPCTRSLSWPITQGQNPYPAAFSTSAISVFMSTGQLV